MKTSASQTRKTVGVETLDDLTALILAKHDEVEASRERMVSTVQSLFEREPVRPGVEGLMHHVQTGIAIYDGVRTGVMIMRRVQALFGRRRRGR
jgi:hypothetical protein